MREEVKSASKTEQVRAFLLRNTTQYDEQKDNAFIVWFWKNSAGQNVMIELNQWGMMRLSVNSQIQITTSCANNIFEYIVKLDKWNNLQTLQ
jgi:hypothetical protein